jgi:tripartite-type tricarboxylate transporter receptor subunit TctC
MPPRSPTSCDSLPPEGAAFCLGTARRQKMAPARFIACVAASVVALGLSTSPRAEDAWPSKPIRIIVPFPAGGSSDPPIRVLAQKLQEALGQSVVVENVSGGGGTLGTARMAQAPADGYTFGMAAVGTFCIAPYLYSKVGYDPLKSFTPITLLGEYANVLVVRTDQPYTSVADLVKAAKDNPGTITFGSSGNGSSNHLSAELLASMSGAKFTHVPYRGTGPALNDLVAGRLSFMFDVTSNSLPWIQAGKLRGIGVSSPKPARMLPDVPPISKSVPGYEVLGWIGLIGPADLPPRIVERLSAEMEKIMRQPDFIHQYSALGFEPRYSKPAEMAAVIKKDYEFWGPVVKNSGAKVD